MSSENLADYLRMKVGEMRKSNTEIARQAGISRRTWYRLLNADVEEARLSTLIKLASVLDTSVVNLLGIYYGGKAFNKLPKVNLLNEQVASGVPDNSIVNIGEEFTKTWEVINLQGDNYWKDLSLCCIDDQLEVRMKAGSDSAVQSPRGLFARKKHVDVSFTPLGKKALISVKFKAPNKACTTISHWRFKLKGIFVEDDSFPVLHCLVRVVALR